MSTIKTVYSIFFLSLINVKINPPKRPQIQHRFSADRSKELGIHTNSIHLLHVGKNLSSSRCLPSVLVSFRSSAASWLNSSARVATTESAVVSQYKTRSGGEK